MNTIYFIDDEQDALEQFLKRRNIFFECGFDIAGFETDPVKALAAIRELKPNAVFCDMKMPVLDGIGILEELIKDDSQPVFVMVSAYSELKDIRKTFKKHGFDYIMKPVDTHALIELLSDISDKLNKLPPVMEIETPSRELNEILIILKEHTAMDHTLESISKQLDIGQSTICLLFTKYLNTTFNAHLTKLRMEKAEWYLHNSELMVKEIAALCGYPDRFYFTRIFTKLHNSVTPTEYREAVRSEK